jgi:hypothetical protein
VTPNLLQRLCDHTVCVGVVDLAVSGESRNRVKRLPSAVFVEHHVRGEAPDVHFGTGGSAFNVQGEAALVRVAVALYISILHSRFLVTCDMALECCAKHRHPRVRHVSSCVEVDFVGPDTP